MISQVRTVGRCGGPCLPPSLLTLARLAQFHKRISDREAAKRTTIEQCCHEVLAGKGEEQPFAKCNWMHFSSNLQLYGQAQANYTRSLELVRQAALIQGAVHGSDPRNFRNSVVGSGQGHLQPAGRLDCSGVADPWLE